MHLTRAFKRSFRIMIQIAVLFALPVLAASDHQRIHLLPQFKPGDSLRYQIESQMNLAGTTTSPIVNPEGATQVKQSVSIVLRLDVLEIPPAAPRPVRPERIQRLAQTMRRQHTALQQRMLRPPRCASAPHTKNLPPHPKATPTIPPPLRSPINTIASKDAPWNSLWSPMAESSISKASKTCCKIHPPRKLSAAGWPAFPRAQDFHHRESR